mgnify:FL=1
MVDTASVVGSVKEDNRSSDRSENTITQHNCKITGHAHLDEESRSCTPFKLISLINGNKKLPPFILDFNMTMHRIILLYSAYDYNTRN